ncbi:hypothetical protein GCM10023144_33140 [Pigmentiphaga soli]|uniref:Uncharacterized protein n=1 Tax=Pigmentiphaga soli TaxID=1007095 RepID=A0ABP8HCV0_9BURK
MDQYPVGADGKEPYVTKHRIAMSASAAGEVGARRLAGMPMATARPAAAGRAKAPLLPRGGRRGHP